MQQAIIENNLEFINDYIKKEVVCLTNDEWNLALTNGRLDILKILVPESMSHINPSVEILSEIIENGHFDCLLYCFEQQMVTLSYNLDIKEFLKDFFLSDEYPLEVRKKLFHTILQNTDEIAQMMIRDDSYDTIDCLKSLRYDFTIDDLRELEENREDVKRCLREQDLVIQACRKPNIEILKFLIDENQFYYSQPALEVAFETSLNHGQYLLQKGLYLTEDCKTTFDCYGDDVTIKFDDKCYMNKLEKDVKRDNIQSETYSEIFNFAKSNPIIKDENELFWQKVKKGRIAESSEKVFIHQDTGIIFDADNIFFGIYDKTAGKIIREVPAYVNDWIVKCGLKLK